MRRQRAEKSRQTCEKHLLFFRMFVKQVYRGFVESRITAVADGKIGAGEGPKRLRIVERVERITGSAWQGRRMRKAFAGIETGRKPEPDRDALRSRRTVIIERVKVRRSSRQGCEAVQREGRSVSGSVRRSPIDHQATASAIGAARSFVRPHFVTPSATYRGSLPGAALFHRVLVATSPRVAVRRQGASRPARFGAAATSGAEGRMKRRLRIERRLARVLYT